MSEVKVLHVTEAFEGGVKTALLQYCESLPEVGHGLLATTGRAGTRLTVPSDHFDAQWEMHRNPIRALAQIRRTVSDWNPDIVHAHSSFAGLYVRLALKSSLETPVVYTPHGYGFERLDISPARRNLFKIVERLLSINCEATIACGRREQRLAESMWSRKSFYVPNVADDPFRSQGSVVASGSSDRPVVACVGRIAAQRDPFFVSAAFREMREVVPSLELRWIGDGDRDLRSALENAGIVVTGWLNPNEVLKELSDVTVFVHPGVWDGLAIAILEAHSLGLPIVARASSSIEDAPENVKASSSHELAIKVCELLSTGGEAAARNHQIWSTVLQMNTVRKQRQFLASAYAEILGVDVDAVLTPCVP